MSIGRLEEHAEFDAGRNRICLFPTFRGTLYVLLKEFFEREDMVSVHTIDLRNCRVSILDLYNFMLEFLLSDRYHKFILPSTIDSASILYFGEKAAMEHEDDDTSLSEDDVVVLSRKAYLRVQQRILFLPFSWFGDHPHENPHGAYVMPDMIVRHRRFLGKRLDTTPLHEACFRGDVEGVRQLCAGDAHCYVRDGYGRWPIEDAVEAGQHAVVTELLWRGASWYTPRAALRRLCVTDAEAGVEALDDVLDMTAEWEQAIATTEYCARADRDSECVAFARDFYAWTDRMRGFAQFARFVRPCVEKMIACCEAVTIKAVRRSRYQSMWQCKHFYGVH